MYYHALKLSRLAMLTLAGVAVSASAIAADSAPTSQIGPTAEAYIVSHPDKVGEVVATYLAEHPEFLVRRQRDVASASADCATTGVCSTGITVSC